MRKGWVMVVKWMFGAAVVLSAALSQGVVAQSPEPLPLAPVSPWLLDYGDSSCALQRNFAGASRAVILQMQSRLNANWLSFAVISRDMPPAGSDLQLRVEPDDAARALRGQSFGAGGEGRGVAFQTSLLPTSAASSETAFVQQKIPHENRSLRESSITGLTVTGAFAQPIHLNTGSLGDPMAALRDCLDDLWSERGIDMSLDDAVAMPAVPIGQRDTARRIQNAYPRNMVRAGRNATVYVGMEIDAEGHVIKCRAHNPEPFPIFEEVTCDLLLRHARYEPARDSAGNAIPTVEHTIVTFETR